MTDTVEDLMIELGKAIEENLNSSTEDRDLGFLLVVMDAKNVDEQAIVANMDTTDIAASLRTLVEALEDKNTPRTTH